MGSTNGGKLALFMVAALALFSLPTLWAGGLYLSKHEGDMIHLLQIVLRMADGDLPHVDFMTPLGLFGFAPAAVLVSAGMGAGMAMIWSQVLLGAVLLPLAWWAAHSRMQGPVAYVFGGIVMLLCVALMQGTHETNVSLSMHYNRWCWAASFVAIAVAALPAKRSNVVADGVVVGVAMALILMIKATYFIGFAPAVIVGLLMHKNAKAFGVALVTGIVILAGITIFTGVEFWLAYIRDLLAVAGSEQRAGASLPIMDVIATPAYIPATAALLAGVIFTRQSGSDTLGLVLLILAPGFWYVTYQNYENEPQWLILLAIILWAARPAGDVENRQGWNLRYLTSVTALVSAALIAPTVINLAYSPFRHMQASADEFSPFLADQPQHDDFQLFNIRVFRMDQRRAAEVNLPGGEAFSEKAKREEVTVWQGQSWAYCTTDVGFLNWYRTMAAQLQRGGYGDARILMTDILSPLSIFGDFPALKGGAPWYYGKLSGLPDAQYVLVPFCPIADDTRAAMLKHMDEIGVPVSEVQRTDQYVLFEIDRDT